MQLDKALNSALIESGEIKILKNQHLRSFYFAGLIFFCNFALCLE